MTFCHWVAIALDLLESMYDRFAACVLLMSSNDVMQWLWPLRSWHVLHALDAGSENDAFTRYFRRLAHPSGVMARRTLRFAVNDK